MIGIQKSLNKIIWLHEQIRDQLYAAITEEDRETQESNINSTWDEQLDIEADFSVRLSELFPVNNVNTTASAMAPSINMSNFKINVPIFSSNDSDPCNYMNFKAAFLNALYTINCPDST